MRDEPSDRPDGSEISPARLERIARDLAEALSEDGEADWIRFLALAAEVAGRLDRQFDAVMETQTDRAPGAAIADPQRLGPRRRPSFNKET